MATQVVEAAAGPAKAEAFVGKVLSDTTGFAVTVLSSIGDRLGLWKEPAGHGAATSDGLGARAGVDERYGGRLTTDPTCLRSTEPRRTRW
jgi:hypothetical protein